MNIDCASLKIGIQKALSNSITEIELSELVKLSRIIVCSYLNNIRGSLVYLCSQQGLTTNDIAYDCIAEVFAREKDRGRRFYKIDKFCRSLNDDFESTDEKEIFLAYKSFILKFADAQLKRLYSLNDPSGSKIHRNIRDAVKKSDMFIIRSRLGWATVLPKYVEPLEHLPHFPLEELEKEYFSNNKGRGQTFLDHLQTIYDIVTKQEDYSRVIPILDLVHILKKYYTAGTSNDELLDIESSSSFNEHIELDNLDIEDLQTRVLSSLKEEIFINYYAKGKFNREQAEAVFYVLQDVVHDWCFSAGCQDSFYNYLKRHREVNETEYFNEYKTKLEYLIKLAKDEFILLLDSEL